jgi:hypothetical protein
VEAGSGAGHRSRLRNGIGQHGGRRLDALAPVPKGNGVGGLPNRLGVGGGRGCGLVAEARPRRLPHPAHVILVNEGAEVLETVECVIFLWIPFLNINLNQMG